MVVIAVERDLCEHRKQRLADRTTIMVMLVLRSFILVGGAAMAAARFTTGWRLSCVRLRRPGVDLSRYVDPCGHGTEQQYGTQAGT